MRTTNKAVRSCCKAYTVDFLHLFANKSPMHLKLQFAVTQRRAHATKVAVRTSAMKVMLSLHPQIVAPGKDEIKFFTKYWNASLQWYLDQMPFSKPNEITIEKSPQFNGKCAPERIQYLFPHVKLILVVRHPIIRAISEYLQDVSTGRTASESSFEKEVMKEGKINQFYHSISKSMYDYHMRRWLKYLPLEQIHIVNGDKFAEENPAPQLAEVAKFLTLQPYFKENMFEYNKTKGFYCWKKPDSSSDIPPVCLGENKGRKHPIVSTVVLEKMIEFFKPHMQEFYQLVGQDFGWDL